MGETETEVVKTETQVVAPLETVTFIVYSMPKGDYVEFLKAAKLNCEGKYAKTIKFLVDAFNSNQLLVLNGRINELEKRIGLLEEKTSEKKPAAKTLGSR